MIYFIGGAPRAGKSILCQQVCARLKAGWISTDLLYHLLRMKGDEGVKTKWDATPAAIRTDADWFYPYLEKFTWGASSMAEDYIIEGVSFLPEHIKHLSTKYKLRAIFLGCSRMTLETFDQYPGRSPGYSFLPEDFRRQIVQDVPLWSEFIRQEAERFNYPYIDTAGDFHQRLREAEDVLCAQSVYNPIS